ncbi:response regulator transcription factor [Aequorivita sp. KMM 9714]|uniref:response regulator transcription factor n=1 Tax=Aequorivita sp. KMM 9714 TaxID=2707173 RepID=UPI0013EB532F|nr:response regulator transcription factor [Aequorivita sp. KMM 9714]NGX84862.1 response regulator transcription factor [Aequorivita sp. KMM 9714]
MRFEELTVVIVKSFPLVIEYYRELFIEISESYKRFHFRIEVANNYVEAIDLLNRIKSERKRVDLMILDLMIPGLAVKGILFGEDIGELFRKNHPKGKIIITTGFPNNYRINSVMKSINPEGILVESDLNVAVFKFSIIEVLNNSIYYSRSVSKWLNSYRNCDFTLDKWDRLLLYALSQNIKTKELTMYLPFSLSTIEKRKKRIKLQFGVDQGDNRDLLLRAREFGFI